MIRVRNILDVVHLNVQVKYNVQSNPEGGSTVIYEVSGDLQRGQTEVSVESDKSVEELVNLVTPNNFVAIDCDERGLTSKDNKVYDKQLICEFVPNINIGIDNIDIDEKKQCLADIDTVRTLYPPLIDKMFEEGYPDKPIAQEIPIHDYKQAHRILESKWFALDSKLASFSPKQLNTGYKVEECSEEKAKKILKSAIY